MTPKLSLDGIKKSRPWEIAIRFLFGGVITALAGLVSKRWGPVVGGLFLAFPAILPASLTLVKQHDGRQRAVDDARGGRLGSVGLVAFAATVWALAAVWPPVLVLLAATVAWALVDGLLWGLLYGRKT